jgi:hypothetical protein
MKAKACKKSTGMNRLETAYWEYLCSLKARGEILDCMWQPLKLNLAPGLACTYAPDFMVVRTDGVLEMHETKGFWRDDARVKLKVAAAKYPFVFVAVTRQRKNDPWAYEFFTDEQQ